MSVESGDLAASLPSTHLVSPDGVLLAPVLVVEDDALMQRRIVGVLASLGYKLEALVFARSIAEARVCMAAQCYALALVDLGLPDGNGVSVIEQLRADNPGAPVLVISAWSTPEIIMTALRSGATGYVLKERDDIELSLAVRSVLRGGAPIDPFIARRILELAQASAGALPGMTGNLNGHASQRPEQLSCGVSETSLSGQKGQKGQGGPDGPDGPDGPEAGAVHLSPREHEILQLVAQGLTNREIALQIFLSRHTVECHIKHVYQKLAVSTRTKAVFAARSRGWLA